MFEYSELLDAAALAKSQEKQISLVAAFSIGQQQPYYIVVQCTCFFLGQQPPFMLYPYFRSFSIVQ